LAGFKKSSPLKVLGQMKRNLVNGRHAAASDKAYQLLAHGRWFSPGTPASSNIKTGHPDIAEILLKVALKHQKNRILFTYMFYFRDFVHWKKTMIHKE
jgi:hypothetical protein